MPDQVRRPRLSVVVPVHNEAAMLMQALGVLRERLEPFVGDYEVLLCENGSRDATASLARSLALRWPHLRVYALPLANYGLALRVGLTHAAGRYVAILNIDFLDFAFLEHALRVIETEALDIVVGSKQLPSSSDQRSVIRRWLTFAFNRLLHVLFHTKLTDTHGLKLLRLDRLRPLLPACELDGELFDTELLLRAEQAGLRIRELPVILREVRPTRYPAWMRVPSTLRDLLRLIWHVKWRIRGADTRNARQGFYDTIADSFDAIMNTHELAKRLHLVFDRGLRSEALEGALLLDAGCGTGEFSRRAAAAGARVVALDIGPRLIRRAQTKVPGLRGVVGDLAALPILDGAFDYIICSEVIEHTRSPSQAIAELSRVLKPGGTLVVTAPNRLWLCALVVARLLRVRPYEGNEHWVTMWQLRRWLSEARCQIVGAWGFNIAPLVFPATYRVIDACDRFGHWLGPFMVNLGVVARKMPAEPDRGSVK